MKSIIRLALILSIIFSQVPATLLYAFQDDLFGGITDSKDPVIVKGDKVEYFHDQKKITGTGNVSISYGEVKLACDKITVYTDTKEAICEGNVTISQPGASMRGDKINYNFLEKKGYALESQIRAKPFYGGAGLVEQTGEKSFKLEEGYITTCDLDNPHYRIEAKEIQLFLDEKVLAKHIVFYVGRVPILYLPIYMQPLAGKFPEVTAVPGRTGDWGYYVLTAWRYFFSEDSKGFINVDYREKKGLAGGIDYQYDAKALGKGIARFYYTRENDDLTFSKKGPADDRWRIQYRHEIQLPEDTVGIWELNKLSDKNIIKNYLYREYEEDPNPDNYVMVQTAKPNYVLTLLARMRMNDFLNVTQRLPEIQLQVNNQRLWNTNFYYLSESAMTNFAKMYPDDENLPSEKSLRLDTFQKLSYAAKLFNLLYVTPFIATRQTYYSRNKWKDPSRVRGIYEGGVELSARFYRIFDAPRDFLGMNLNKLRHIISPSVRFLHRHQPSISPSNLYQFDAIDAIEYYNGFQMSLETKLQTKRPEGDSMKAADLARLVVSTEYTFRQKENFFQSKGTAKFGDIDFKLDLWPYEWLYLEGIMRLDSKQCDLNFATTDVYVNFTDKFTLGIGQRYERIENETTNQFTGEMYYNINDDWKVKVYQRFDVITTKWLEQEYTLTKDLHCWLAELTFDIRNRDYTAWLVFRLKAFPELPIGLLKTTYRRPSPGHKR